MKQILVAKDVTLNAATTPNDVTDGAIAIFGRDNTLVTAGQTIYDHDSIYLVQGVPAGDVPRVTPLIKGTNVTVWKGVAKVAGVKQVSYAGFVGSGTNSFSITSVEYGAKIVDVTSGANPMPAATASYSVDSSPTPWKIADALAKQLNADSQNPAYVEVLADITTTGFTGTVTVTNGSDVVTASSGSHGVVAGDYIRIGHDTTKTYPVFKVKSVSGTTITLTRPFVSGDLTTYAWGVAVASVDAGNTSTAPTSTDEAGFKLTGKLVTKAFLVSIDEDYLGSTVITYTTARTSPIGLGSDILLAETASNVEEGNQDQLNTYSVNGSRYAVSGSTYDVYTITYRNSANPSAAGQVFSVDNTIQIAFISTATTNQNIFESVLNPWMASTPGAFVAVNL